MPFYFLGKGPFSKSLILRALITQSYFPELKIIGDSQCGDVLSMKMGLKNLKTHTTIDGLHGGAVLRFLALRASRETGEFVLKGSVRLFQRPIRELQTILNQLTCEAKITEDSLVLKTRGWHLSGDALTLSANRSSQFASAVFLNSWNLKHDLFINIEGSIVSSSYFKMTLSFLRSLGMRVDGKDGEYHIPAGQKINQFTYQSESDMSCLFSLAALAGVGGEVVFTDWPEKSLQPDFIFPAILKNMGFRVKQEGSTLKVARGEKLKPINCNVKDCPDLFPILSALCALAEGASHLYGAPQLLYKESNRITQTAKLLRQAGREVKILKDGLVIKGKLGFSKKFFVFDPEEDHRMAMSAAVLKEAGLPVRILTPEVVNKSFPDFWSTVNIKL